MSATPLLPEHIELTDWIRTQVREGCVRIALRQRIHDIEQHVREWPIDPSTDVDGLADIIRLKMNDEARALRGPTLFGLLSFEPGRPIHHDKLTRRVEGMGGHADALIGETEAADARGIVSQMMRHNEAAARIALGQTLEIVEHYKSILKASGERVATLEDKHMQVLDLFEKLASLQHQRNLEITREKRRDEGRAYFRQKLDLLGPVVIAKVLGAKDAKGSGSMMGEELLRQFFKSLTEPQAKALWPMLTQEQAITLIELYERYGTQDMARERAAAAATETNDAEATTPARPTDEPPEGADGSPPLEVREEEKK